MKTTTQSAMPTETTPDPLDGLREQVAEALWMRLTSQGWEGLDPTETQTLADAVLAVVRPVVDALTAERDDARDNERAAWETCDAKVAALREQIDRVRAETLDEAADLLRDFRETFEEHERKSILSGETAIRMLAGSARAALVVTA